MAKQIIAVFKYFPLAGWLSDHDIFRDTDTVFFNPLPDGHTAHTPASGCFGLIPSSFTQHLHQRLRHFKGEPHAVPKRKDAKHNPLHWLTYLSLAALLLSDQMTTGFVYWGYNPWTDWGLSWLSLEVIALIHTTCAFAILQFLIIHHYMATTALVVIYPFPAFTRSDMISHSNSAGALIIWYHARLRQGASL